MERMLASRAVAAGRDEAIRILEDGDWRSTVPMSDGRRHRLGTLLGGITGGPGGAFRHAWAHLPDLEAYVRTLGR